MKITESRIKRIIQEEIERFVQEQGGPVDPVDVSTAISRLPNTVTSDQGWKSMLGRAGGMIDGKGAGSTYDGVLIVDESGTEIDHSADSAHDIRGDVSDEVDAYIKRVVDQKFSSKIPNGSYRIAINIG